MFWELLDSLGSYHADLVNNTGTHAGKHDQLRGVLDGGQLQGLTFARGDGYMDLSA